MEHLILLPVDMIERVCLFIDNCTDESNFVDALTDGRMIVIDQNFEMKFNRVEISEILKNRDIVAVFFAGIRDPHIYIVAEHVLVAYDEQCTWTVPPPVDWRRVGSRPRHLLNFLKSFIFRKE